MLSPISDILVSHAAGFRGNGEAFFVKQDSAAEATGILILILLTVLRVDCCECMRHRPEREKSCGG